MWAISFKDEYFANELHEGLSLLRRAVTTSMLVQFHLDNLLGHKSFLCAQLLAVHLADRLAITSSVIKL